MGSHALVSDLALFKNNRGLAAALGILLTGLGWSLGIWLANASIIAASGVGNLASFALVAVGGLSQILALWVGFSAVCWAMVRAFGGKISLACALNISARAAFPLCFGAAATALWLYQEGGLTVMAPVLICLSGMAFTALASRALAAETGWHLTRSLLVLAATIVFLASVVSLAT